MGLSLHAFPSRPPPGVLQQGASELLGERLVNHHVQIFRGVAMHRRRRLQLSNKGDGVGAGKDDGADADKGDGAGAGAG